MATLNLQVGASSDDAHSPANTTNISLTALNLSFGNNALARDVGIRFTGLSVLQGATIISATLTFRAAASDTEDFVGDWFGWDTDDPATFEVGQNLAALTRTTATCEGDGVDFGEWTSGNDHTFTGDGTNTIADIIQELIDTHDTDAIALLWIYDSGTGERVAESYDNNTALAAKLDIEYALPGGKGSGGKGKGPGGGGGNDPGTPGKKGNPPGQRAANIVANSWRWRR